MQAPLIQWIPNVLFSRNGWRQLAKLNRCLGANFIRGFELRSELAEYIAAHYASGRTLDFVCQEVRYEDGVYLLLKQIGDGWYITDIWSAEKPIGFSPILLWQRVKRGFTEILCQIVIGWRDMIKEPSPWWAY